MEEFTSGYPLPPFFYKNYSFRNKNVTSSKVCMPTTSLTSNESSEDILCIIDTVSGPRYPSPPNSPWYSFGVEEKLEFELHELDSETIINIPKKDNDLKKHFQILYGDFMDCFMLYLRHLKEVDNDSVSDIKKLIKLYMNLQYVLYTFSERKAEYDVVRMLREQLYRRRHYIDCLKVALLDTERLLSAHLQHK